MYAAIASASPPRACLRAALQCAGNVRAASGAAAGLRQRYDVLVEGGRLQPDERQHRALGYFEELQRALKRDSDHGPAMGAAGGSDSDGSGGGLLSRLFGMRSGSGGSSGAAPTVRAPQGLYLWGGVGCGKTMCMDLFFDAVEVQRKRRVHFHAFMLDVHDRIHRWRQRNSGDPVPPVAEQLSQEARLLCFDEFQVTDISDAMIVRRLFEHVFRHGCVMVATSNRHPDHLYEGGLNRQLFVPFIHLLKQHCRVVGMEEGQDYRRIAGGLAHTFNVPADAHSRRVLDDWFRQLSGGSDGAERVVPVMMGRQLRVPRAAGRVARCSFADLCARPLGAADYLAICKHFDVLVLDGVPRLGASATSEARRFITLVDVLYEHNVRLLCSADAPAHELFGALDRFAVMSTADGAVPAPQAPPAHHHVQPTPASRQAPPPHSHAHTAPHHHHNHHHHHHQLQPQQQQPQQQQPQQQQPQQQQQHAAGEAQQGGASEELSDAAMMLHAEGGALRDLAFAYSRAVSRLIEMQGEAYLRRHEQVRGGDGAQSA